MQLIVFLKSCDAIEILLKTETTLKRSHKSEDQTNN